VFVALVIQHAMCMRHIMLLTVVCLVPQHFFPHYLTKGTSLGKGLLAIKCAFWFSLHLLSETFLIPRRTGRDVLKTVYRSSCNVSVIFCKTLYSNISHSKKKWTRYYPNCILVLCNVSVIFSKTLFSNISHSKKN